MVNDSTSRHSIGLVGAGGISAVHAAAWTALGADVTVWSEEGQEALASRFGFRTASSLEELLPAVDIVDVCTPTATHADIVRRSIEAGANVICEKPLARTSAEAQRLVDLADRAGRKLFPGHVVRYFPEYRALRDAVAAGRIGEPAILRFTRGGAAPGAAWFYDEVSSGGLVFDQMIHDLDQARWIAGPVSTVFATQNPRSSGGRLVPPVVCHVVLTHTSGAVSFVQGNWGPPGLQFTTSFDVAGSAGRLQYDSTSTASVQANLAGGDRSASYLPTLVGESPYTAEIRDFVRAFDGESEPLVTARDGMVAVALAEAATESMRTGAPVAFDDAALGAPVGAVA